MLISHGSMALLLLPWSPGGGPAQQGLAGPAGPRESRFLRAGGLRLPRAGFRLWLAPRISGGFLDSRSGSDLAEDFGWIWLLAFIYLDFGWIRLDLV